MIATDSVDQRQHWRTEHPIPFAAATILAAACGPELTPCLRFEIRRIVALLPPGRDLFAVRRGERHLARLYVPLQHTRANEAWLEERGAGYVHWVVAERSFTFLMGLDDIALHGEALIDRLAGIGSTSWSWLEMSATASIELKEPTFCQRRG